MASYDVVVIGTGPGGYETAIRATQLGFKTAVIEKNKLGGVCLNIGCIPTKALLKSAEMMAKASHFADYGLDLEGSVTPNFAKVIQRSRGVANKMNKGVQFLMKKNGIDVIYGKATLKGGGTIAVEPSIDMDGNEIGETTTVDAKHIIVATGARAREIPPLPVDGTNVVAYKDAMTQTERPERMVIVGAGAIGVEFAYVYHNMGTKVTLIEVLDRLVPVEDRDVSKELGRAYKKMGVELKLNAKVQGYEEKDGALHVRVETKKGEEIIVCDQILSAVGVVGNVEGIGLEEVGVEVERGAVVTDGFGRTGVEGIYAIGDVAGPPWLAHKASHEGILCIEKIAGHDVRPMDKAKVPGCTYCIPEIGSVGFTEEAAKEAGYELLVGKFPFTASGKASAIGDTGGFVKVIYDKKYGELLGCHIIGANATEMIAEAVTARELETTYHEIIEAMHPHPTLSEAVMEATRVAIGEPMNI